MNQHPHHLNQVCFLLFLIKKFARNHVLWMQRLLCRNVSGILSLYKLQMRLWLPASYLQAGAYSQSFIVALSLKQQHQVFKFHIRSRSHWHLLNSVRFIIIVFGVIFKKKSLFLLSPPAECWPSDGLVCDYASCVSLCSHICVLDTH